VSVTLLTYLWHYLAARAVYDSFLRPLAHGHAAPLALVLLIAGFAFLLGRWSIGRRRR
jgi:hypothetical protein